MIQIIHTFTCDRCLESGPSSRYHYTDGMVMAKPELPSGWHSVQWSIFCPKHKVNITVDRKKWATV